jgi:hypothetical protein
MENNGPSDADKYLNTWRTVNDAATGGRLIDEFLAELHFFNQDVFDVIFFARADGQPPDVNLKLLMDRACTTFRIRYHPELLRSCEYPS